MSRFEIKDTSKGRGVFTKEPIAKGSLVINWSGKILNRDELPRPYGKSQDLYTQIGDNKFTGPSGNFDDLNNHSCDPNCGMKFRT